MKPIKFLTPLTLCLITLNSFAVPFVQQLTIANYTRTSFSIYQEADSHTGRGATPGKNQKTIVPAGMTVLSPQEQVAHWGGSKTHHTAAMCLDTVGQSPNGSYIIGNIYINSEVYAAVGVKNLGESHFDNTHIWASNGAPNITSSQYSACYSDSNNSHYAGIDTFKTYGPKVLLPALGKPFTQSSTSPNPVPRPSQYFSHSAYKDHNAASNFEALGFASSNNQAMPTTSIAEVYYVNMDGKHGYHGVSMNTRLYMLCLNPNGKASSTQGMCPTIKLGKPKMIAQPIKPAF